MNDNQLIKKDTILKIKNTMNNLRTKNKMINKELDNIISDGTKEEKKFLEKAIENYNTKVKKVLNSDKVKSKINEKYECEDKIIDLVSKVKNAFRKAVRQINIQPISDEEKNKKIVDLGKAIEDAILTDDEKKIMNAIKNQLKTLPFQRIKMLC